MSRAMVGVGVMLGFDDEVADAGMMRRQRREV
jgi:hypothetical protein